MACYKKGEMPVHLGRYIDRKLVFFTISKIEPRPLKVYKKKKNDNRKNSSSY